MSKDSIIDEFLLEVIACPKCKGRLVLKDNYLICEKDRLKFKIIDGIPDLLLEDAEKL